MHDGGRVLLFGSFQSFYTGMVHIRLSQDDHFSVWIDLSCHGFCHRDADIFAQDHFLICGGLRESMQIHFSEYILIHSNTL